MTDAEFEAGVQRWHGSDSTLDIWEFLGMSRDEYDRHIDRRVAPVHPNQCAAHLDCGGYCHLQSGHEPPCLCVGDTDGPGTCPA